MMPMNYTTEDFDHSPFIVFYEVTRACDLACQHCRACAQPIPHKNQLSTEQSKALIDQLASFPKPPMLVMTGGDPLKREDIFELVKYGRSKNLSVSMTPSATPLVTHEALAKLKEMGLHRLAVSLDGKDQQTHDSFRGVKGSFTRTMEIVEDAKTLQMPMQINTTITKRNVDQIDDIAELVSHFGIELWSVFFLIPVGRGLAEQRISPEEYEIVFERLWEHARKQPYAIKTTEAHHYRRFVLQRAGNPLKKPDTMDGRNWQRAPLGVNDGRGVMFVSHVGQVFPSGFMPIDCGRYPKQSVVDIYQNSPTFKQLRDPDQLGGKCGRCDYRHICGGSRARSYALTGDPMAAEPDCVYQPQLAPTVVLPTEL